MTTTTPRSWKAGVKTAGDRSWAYNALRFATKAEAEAYGTDLAMRWTAVREVEAHPSDDEPTDTWPRSR